MQDVSDKLLGQFVECLRSKVAVPSAAPSDAPSAVAAVGADPAAVPAQTSQEGPSTGPSVSAAPPRTEALDLGATVLPVLLKAYGKQVGVALLVVLLLVRLIRRRRS